MCGMPHVNRAVGLEQGMLSREVYTIKHKYRGSWNERQTRKMRGNGGGGVRGRMWLRRGGAEEGDGCMIGEGGGGKWNSNVSIKYHVKRIHVNQKAETTSLTAVLLDINYTQALSPVLMMVLIMGQ
ncbi:hypothetical protein RJ639_005354 [Escallonia herrerae]|uniref:Uncharacterized protein n=1 Tax=Escallonia herrerae TaxID=1293975 RepID=A0AA88VZB9_9ASTE|nr:hypothetical protein RJ639_005354 [Escallonia herrerae]